MLVEYARTECKNGLLHPDALRCLYIRTVMQIHGNNSKCARLLGLPRRTVQRVKNKNPDRRTGDKCNGRCAECKEWIK